MKAEFQLTPDQFAAAKAKFEGTGVKIDPGPSGTITARGVTVRFDYAGSTLSIEVLGYGGHSHFFVDHAIKGWFR